MPLARTKGIASRSDIAPDSTGACCQRISRTRRAPPAATGIYLLPFAVPSFAELRVVRCAGIARDPIRLARARWITGERRMIATIPPDGGGNRHADSLRQAQRNRSGRTCTGSPRETCQFLRTRSDCLPLRHGLPERAFASLSHCAPDTKRSVAGGFPPPEGLTTGARRLIESSSVAFRCASVSASSDRGAAGHALPLLPGWPRRRRVPERRVWLTEIEAFRDEDGNVWHAQLSTL